MSDSLMENQDTVHRDALVREMAHHICAGVSCGLNTVNDQDVIACLWNAPQRYHHRLILDNLDESLALAKEILDQSALHDDALAVLGAR
jgi:hypothetical protein